MKFIVISLVLTFVLFSCSESESSNAVIEQGEMMNTTVNDTCPCNDLVDSLSVLYLDDIPYTGVCIHNYPNSDKKYIVKGIMNGKLHGKLLYYDQSGKVILEEIYDSGSKTRNGNNAPITCDCSELLIKPIPGETITCAFLDEIPFTGKCTKSYAGSTQKYMDASYQNGVLEGFTTYFDKSGKAMFMEKYERGELIKVIRDQH